MIAGQNLQEYMYEILVRVFIVLHATSIGSASRRQWSPFVVVVQRSRNLVKVRCGDQYRSLPIVADHVYNTAAKTEELEPMYFH